MKLTSYRKVICMAKEKIDEALAPVRALQMKKKAEGEMLKIEENMITTEAKIQELASKYPVDFDVIIRAIDEAALLGRRKKQFAKIIDEMFESEE